MPTFKTIIAFSINYNGGTWGRAKLNINAFFSHKALNTFLQIHLALEPYFLCFYAYGSCIKELFKAVYSFSPVVERRVGEVKQSLQHPWTSPASLQMWAHAFMHKTEAFQRQVCKTKCMCVGGGLAAGGAAQNMMPNLQYKCRTSTQQTV